MTVSTRVIPAAGREYFRRLRTHFGTSTFMAVAEAMVESDTGARLSPKAAPPRIAPAKNAGSTPNSTPVGYKTPIQAAIVPNLVPVAEENRVAARNEMTVNNTGPTTKDPARPARPAANQDSPKILAKTPAKIQVAMGKAVSLLAIPEITALLYSFLFLARKNGITTPKKMGIQSAPSAVDPHQQVVTKIKPIKIIIGDNKTHSHPSNSNFFSIRLLLRYAI